MLLSGITSQEAFDIGKDLKLQLKFKMKMKRHKKMHNNKWSQTKRRT
jgi:hypothetical protein